MEVSLAMNINSINYSNQEEALKSASINIRNNVEGDGKTASTALSGTTLSGLSELGKTTNTQNSGANAKLLLQETDDVLEQLKESAENAQGSLKALFKKLSGADCVRLDEDGYGLNDTEPEKIITVVERIKIMLAAYCDNYDAAGMDIDAAEAEKVVGSVSMANKVVSKLSDYDVPASEENVREAEEAVGKLQNAGQLSENAKNYLVKNELEPTIDNIYYACHKSSGEAYFAVVDETAWSELKPQAEDIIKRSGLKVNEQNLNNARTFMGLDIPVTEDNLCYKAELDALDMETFSDNDGIASALDAIAEAMSEGRAAGEARVTGESAAWRQVAEAIRISENADEADVCRVMRDQEELTLENLAKGMDSKEGEGDNTLAQTIQSMTREELEGYRRLEEIRILMTADAGLSLAKQGFNLNTSPIAELVEKLKELELAWAGDEETADRVYEVQEAVYNIARAPVEVIGRSVSSFYEENQNGQAAALYEKTEDREVITLGDFAQTGESLRQRYREAGRTYEAVGTQVRRDLKDSLGKAVDASADGLLDSLGLENNAKNREAVRILAGSGMEITNDNIEKVKQNYASLRSLIKNMKPDAVLAMIREGKNPMQSDINDVSGWLQENSDSNREEKFSTFLYKLDRTNGITDEERRQFIGIYRMTNIFTRDAGQAIGTLLKQGSDITMSNLMTAYNSRRAGHIDRTIDDSAGMAEISGTVNYYNTLFDDSAEKITPRTLKLVNDEKHIDERSVENFIESVNDNYSLREEASYYDKYLQSIEAVKDADAGVIRELERFDENISVSAIHAMQDIMNTGFSSSPLAGMKRRDKENASTILEHLGDDEEASVRRELEASVKHDVEEALESVNDRDEFETLRMRYKEIVMINNMAKKHDYRIPYDNGGDLGTIHLQIVEDEENSGRIVIDTDTKELGRLHMEVRQNTGEISLFAVTDKSVPKLEERLDGLSKRMANMSYTVGRSDVPVNVTLPAKDGIISTRQLYETAKLLIGAVIK